MLPLHRDDLLPAKKGAGRTSPRRQCERILWVAVLASFLFPLYILTHFKHGDRPAGNQSHRKFVSPFSLADSPQLRFPAPHLHNLVLVAGHSVFVGSNFLSDVDERSWYLENYQKVDGEVASFIQHISEGVGAAAKDPHSLLLFSGGQTRAEAGPRSEGQSYWQVAQAHNWFNQTGVRSRAFTEEHARDSFENLLFSLCRFYELTGHYPVRVTVVSYSMKQARFTDVHRAALKFPKHRFAFIGTPIPSAAKHAEMGEYRVVQAFRDNLYGCKGELLKKRLARDPFAIGPPHPSRCPALKGILEWCSTNEIFPGSVPW